MSKNKENKTKEKLTAASDEFAADIESIVNMDDSDIEESLGSEFEEEFRKNLQDSIDESLREIGYEESDASFYGMEEGSVNSKWRPGKRVESDDTTLRRTQGLDKYRAQTLTRFSNIYMFAGIVIGALVFYFLIAPSIRSEYTAEIQSLKASYTQEISTKNSEIDNISDEVESLTSRNTELEELESEMKLQIDELTEEVELLRKTIEGGGLTVPDSVETSSDEESSEETVTETVTEETTEAVVEETNAAAERNNESVVGISDDEIKGMINDE